MKKLLVLTIIWLGLTINLAYDNLVYSLFVEENVHWRSFLVYNSSLAGCMTGAGIANINYDFPSTYSRCRDYAYKQKNDYELKWSEK